MSIDLVLQANTILKQFQIELFQATDSVFITFGLILSLNPRGKISTNSQINQETMD